MATDTQRVQHTYDRVLLTVTLLLIGTGLVMVYSASVVTAETQMGDGLYFLKRQLLYMVPALGALFIGLSVHHELWKRLAWPLLAVGVLLLAVVLIPGVASTAKGASRWLNLGFFRLQPSEIVKVALIIWLAMSLSRRQNELHRWQTAWARHLAVAVVLAAPLMLQPDFGSTVICCAMVGLMVWAAGAKQWHTGLLMMGGVGLASIAIVLEPYRLKRVLAFLSPEDDPQGVAYQINQALISFGSGQLTGLGLGASRQKLLYLPDAHTDFIFSIIGEELGLLGATFVLVLFAIFVWRGFRIARQATHSFGALLAFGLTAMIGLQAMTNMAVVTALLPTKGLTLPFISYGGSSLVVLCGAVGVLLNVSKRLPPPAWLHRERSPVPPQGASTGVTEQMSAVS